MPSVSMLILYDIVVRIRSTTYGSFGDLPRFSRVTSDEKWSAPKKNFLKVLSLDPQDADAWSKLGSKGGGSVNGKRYRRKDCFIKAIAADPQKSCSWFNLGALGGFEINGEQHCPTECLQKSLALEPTGAQAWFSLGAAGGGIVNGKLYSQSTCLQTAIKLDPKYATDWYSVDLSGEGSHIMRDVAMERRRQRLAEALGDFGISITELENGSGFFGTAILGVYQNFLSPKTEEALAVAEMPQQARRVAGEITYLVREAKAANVSFIRNHDWSEGENIRRTAFRTHPLAIVLDDVRDAHKVGNILRTAEAARCQVVTCGITPRPPNPAVLKTALGAAEHVPQRHFSNVFDAIHALKAEEYTVWVVQTSDAALPYREQPVPRRLAILMGSEGDGVSCHAVAAADIAVYVPLHGVKSLLDVGTTAAIIAFHVLGRAVWSDTEPKHDAAWPPQNFQSELF